MQDDQEFDPKLDHRRSSITRLTGSSPRIGFSVATPSQGNKAGFSLMRIDTVSQLRCLLSAAEIWLNRFKVFIFLLGTNNAGASVLD